MAAMSNVVTSTSTWIPEEKENIQGKEYFRELDPDMSATENDNDN